MKRIYWLQSGILCFVGIGALFGGSQALLDPTGTSFGASTDILKTGPFTNFLIPGLFLFFVLGFGHLIASIFVMRRMKFHVYLSGCCGCILMAWILIQCYILHAIVSLHVVFFFIGLIESSIALYMLTKLKQFPFNKQHQNHTI